MSDKELTIEIVKTYLETFCQYKHANGVNSTSPLNMENLSNLITNTYNTIKNLS